MLLDTLWDQLLKHPDQIDLHNFSQILRLYNSDFEKNDPPGIHMIGMDQPFSSEISDPNLLINKIPSNVINITGLIEQTDPNDSATHRLNS